MSKHNVDPSFDLEAFKSAMDAINKSGAKVTQIGGPGQPNHHHATVGIGDDGEFHLGPLQPGLPPDPVTPGKVVIQPPTFHNNQGEEVTPDPIEFAITEPEPEPEMTDERFSYLIDPLRDYFSTITNWTATDRDCKRLIIRAIEIDARAFAYASDRLVLDPEVQRAAFDKAAEDEQGRMDATIREQIKQVESRAGQEAEHHCPRCDSPYAKILNYLNIIEGYVKNVHDNVVKVAEMCEAEMEKIPSEHDKGE